MWDSGQQHLAAARYVAARRELEAAEAVAWRDRDAHALARIYLPLLEARRQIRYNAVEGTLIVSPPAASPQQEQALLADFLAGDSGTILIACSADGGKASARRRHAAADGEQAACRFAGSVQYATQRTGRWLEALLLIRRGQEVRLASQADPTFAAGLPVLWSTTQAVRESTDPNLVIPLPPPGRYDSRTARNLHALGRESLLIAWEALALRWQRRHPPPHSPAAATKPNAAWDELAWLRLALRVDPACEPVNMRLITLAQALART
jgi:hypothetical protein